MTTPAIATELPKPVRAEWKIADEAATYWRLEYVRNGYVEAHAQTRQDGLVDGCLELECGLEGEEIDIYTRGTGVNEMVRALGQMARAIAVHEGQ